MPYKSLKRAVCRLRILPALMLLTSLSSSLQPARVRAADSDLDPSFGNGGKVTTDFLRGGNDQANGVVIQKDGKIVVAGGNSGNFAVARYNPDGSLDATFGDGGRVITGFGGNAGSAHALALQADGKIVVAGSARNDDTGIDFALVRYNPDGSLDITFDGDGTVTTDINEVGGDDQAHAVAIRPHDGKIVAAGYARIQESITSLLDFAIARYNPDGSLDTSFSEDGKITTNIGNRSQATDRARAVAIQPDDGKMIVAGNTFNNGTDFDFALARYGGGDTMPPGITCPPDLQSVTPRPREACASVTYPLPAVTDNLPGATVTCSPTSGSCFSLGVTTVTCTATDATGNTSECSFTVTVFDVILQSDSDPSAELLINSFTGDYSFCCSAFPPGQPPLRSRGQVRSHGNTITLSHTTQTYRLTVSVDVAAGKGSASFKSVSGFALCPIQDRNIFDNLPVLCGNASP